MRADFAPVAYLQCMALKPATLHCMPAGLVQAAVSMARSLRLRLALPFEFSRIEDRRFEMPSPTSIGGKIKLRFPCCPMFRQWDEETLRPNVVRPNPVCSPVMMPAITLLICICQA